MVIWVISDLTTSSRLQHHLCHTSCTSELLPRLRVPLCGSTAFGTLGSHVSRTSSTEKRIVRAIGCIWWTLKRAFCLQWARERPWFHYSGQPNGKFTAHCTLSTKQKSPQPSISSKLFWRISLLISSHLNVSNLQPKKNARIHLESFIFFVRLRSKTSGCQSQNKIARCHKRPG